MKTYRLDYLERLLVQDFGCKWQESRLAVARYMAECGARFVPWWYVLHGDPYAITEWIWGTKRYWEPYKGGKSRWAEESYK
jgi:hypothetical protein